MPSQKKNEIREIEFHGDKILAKPGKGRRDYGVIFKPTCESMGVGYTAQFERIKDAPWAVVRKTRTTGPDGKTYEMVELPRKTFLHWLMTLDTRRIKDPAVAAKVLKYQLEAQDVLDAAFDDDLNFDAKGLIEALQSKVGDLQGNLLAVQAENAKMTALIRSVTREQEKILFFIPDGLYRPTDWWDKNNVPWREIEKINRDDLWPALYRLNKQMNGERRLCKPGNQRAAYCVSRKVLARHWKALKQKYDRLQDQTLFDMDDDA